MKTFLRISSAAIHHPQQRAWHRHLHRHLIIGDRITEKNHGGYSRLSILFFFFLPENLDFLCLAFPRPIIVERQNRII